MKTYVLFVDGRPTFSLEVHEDSENAKYFESNLRALFPDKGVGEPADVAMGNAARPSGQFSFIVKSRRYGGIQRSYVFVKQ